MSASLSETEEPKSVPKISRTPYSGDPWRIRSGSLPYANVWYENDYNDHNDGMARTFRTVGGLEERLKALGCKANEEGLRMSEDVCVSVSSNLLSTGNSPNTE